MTESNNNGEHTRRKHLLLDQAKSYPVSNGDQTPPGCEYNMLLGAWTLKESQQLLVDTPERPKLRTKKMDNETGEDQKGE